MCTWSGVTSEWGDLCIFGITHTPFERHIWKLYENTPTHLCLAIASGNTLISVFGSSKSAFKIGTRVWQGLKCSFSHGGRAAQMHFSPSCTRPIWMQPTWEESQENRLQLGESFVATDSLEMSLCTSYAWKVGVRESTKIAKFFHPLAWKSSRNFLSVAPTEIFKRSILFYSSRRTQRWHPFSNISNNKQVTRKSNGRDRKTTPHF